MYDTKANKKTVVINTSGKKDVPKGTSVRVYDIQHGLAQVRVNWPDNTSTGGVMQAADLEPEA